ncbi:unnamed protein product, partial [Laminaria digitata]
FRRSNSPGECWGETRKWYGARTVGQQIELRKKLTSFNIAKGSDPVEKFLEIEDVCEAMRDAGMDVDDQTVYGIYVAALPSEYDLEIRELSRKQVFDREEIINIVQAQFELQRKKKKSSSSAHALVADGGRGGRGGRGRAGAEKQPAKGPMCFNCRGQGHYARDC